MLRVVLVVALLGCRHPAPPAPTTIGNTATTTKAGNLTPDVVARAQVFLKRAQAMTRMMMYIEAYASAQRGINLLDGNPDLDDGAELLVSQTPAAAKELVLMVEQRTRELERRISKR